MISCVLLLNFSSPSFSAQAPKELKVFINLPRSMGFDDAERSEATQVLELSEEDYKEDGLIPLRYVKFQNVQSVTVRTLTVAPARLLLASTIPIRTQC